METKTTRTLDKSSSRSPTERLQDCLEAANEEIESAGDYIEEAAETIRPGKIALQNLRRADAALHSASQSIHSAASLVRRISKRASNAGASPLWKNRKTTSLAAGLDKRVGSRSRANNALSRSRAKTQTDRPRRKLEQLRGRVEDRGAGNGQPWEMQ